MISFASFGFLSFFCVCFFGKGTSCGKWCYFVSENGVRYIVTNARGKLIVTKPLSTRRLNPTLEMLAVFGSKITARQPGQ